MQHKAKAVIIQCLPQGCVSAAPSEENTVELTLNLNMMKKLTPLMLKTLTLSEPLEKTSTSDNTLT